MKRVIALPSLLFLAALPFWGPVGAMLAFFVAMSITGAVAFLAPFFRP